MAVIIPEANLPDIAMGVMRRIRETGLENTFFMAEDQNPGAGQQRDLAGAYTTRKNKNMMVDVLRDVYIRPLACSFHMPFIVAGEIGICHKHDIRAEFVSEMRQFAEIKVPVQQRDGSVEFERQFSGKAVRADDDFVMALCIGVYMHDRFTQDPRYAPIRHRPARL
jgi:hypothetical protein